MIDSGHEDGLIGLHLDPQEEAGSGGANKGLGNFYGDKISTWILGDGGVGGPNHGGIAGVAITIGIGPNPHGGGCPFWAIPCHINRPDGLTIRFGGEVVQPDVIATFDQSDGIFCHPIINHVLRNGDAIKIAVIGKTVVVAVAVLRQVAIVGDAVSVAIIGGAVVDFVAVRNTVCVAIGGPERNRADNQFEEVHSKRVLGLVELDCFFRKVVGINLSSAADQPAPAQGRGIRCIQSNWKLIQDGLGNGHHRAHEEAGASLPDIGVGDIDTNDIVWVVADTGHGRT